MSSEMPLPNPAGEIWPTSLAELFSFFPTLTSPGLLTWSLAHIWVVLGQLEKGLRDFFMQFVIQIQESFLRWPGCKLETGQISAVTPFPPSTEVSPNLRLWER